VSEEHVRVWFSQPGVNVGVFCGAASGGLVVVDLDDCEFPPAGAALPLTPLVKTGRDPDRGFHLYYRSSADVSTSPFSWGEVRGRSPAYVVAPPSIHPESGRPYAWQLPLQESPLADFSGVKLPESCSLTEDPKNQIAPTKAVLLGTAGTTADKPYGEWLRSFDRDPATVTQMALALGISAPLGSAFSCAIHPERNASAALHRAEETGEWLYHDFHARRHNGAEWLSLAQVRAAMAGRTAGLSAPEHATWKLILLVEAGLLPLIVVAAAPLPAGSDPLVAHVYERFLFLLGCRWNYQYGAPAPYTREFAAALSTVSVRDARDAIDELARLGAIYVATTQPIGGTRRLRLWLPHGIDNTHALDPIQEAA
jgi:hypothetical protein